MRDLPFYAGTLAAAYLLKRHYSTASADELRWILAPTAWLTSHATGSPFPFEAGVGNISREAGFILAPECAGVNFLIIAACSLVFAFTHTRGSAAGKTAFVAASVAVSYLATVVANTIRIVATLRLDPGEEVHRLLGIAIYLTSLLLVHALFRHGLARRAMESPCSARPSSGT
jgi:exosortase K